MEQWKGLGLFNFYILKFHQIGNPILLNAIAD